MLSIRLIFVTGFAASVGQILVLRELLVLFYGNELSTGLILACWLLWTAAGSWLTGRIGKGRPPGPGGLVAGISLLSLSLPATLLWIRGARAVWSVPLGELISPGLMFAIALCSTGLFCFVSGAMFALCWSGSERTEGGGALGVYLAEAAGSCAGGLCYYFLLLPAFTSLTGSILLGLFVAASAGLAVLSARSRFRGAVPASVLVLAALLVNGGLLGFSGKLDQASRRLQWGTGFLESHDTPYHNLAFLGGSGQYSLFCNGLWLCTVPDPQSAEPAAHLPLLQHPKPEKVLLTGEFSPGIIAEILRHPGIRRLDCVQPDPETSEFAARVLPPSYLEFVSDPRLHMHYSDPKRFIASAAGGYSVIIMGAGEPVNAEMNRFYTIEFFSGIRKLLGEGGIFSFGVPSAPDIIGRREAKLLRSLKNTLDAVFDRVLAVPGDGVLFLAGSAGTISNNPEDIIGRMRKRGLDLQYLRDFNILDRFDPLRLSYMESVLEEGGSAGAGINRDFKPVCYLYGLNLWGAQLNPVVGRFLEPLSGEGGAWFPVAPALLVFAAVLILRAKSGPRATIALNTAVSGGVLIVLEIVLVLAYQIISGAMYREMALIISLFMAGVALGGGIGRKIAVGSKKPLMVLFTAQSGIAAYALLLAAGLEILKGIAVSNLATGAIFSMLALVAGMLGGGQFAAAVWAGREVKGMRGAVGLYAADLIGAAAGAVLGSLILLPVLGIPQTLLIIALTGLAGSIGLPERKNHSRP